jgi:hypothetical protein
VAADLGRAVRWEHLLWLVPHAVEQVAVGAAGVLVDAVFCEVEGAEFPGVVTVGFQGEFLVWSIAIALRKKGGDVHISFL